MIISPFLYKTNFFLSVDALFLVLCSFARIPSSGSGKGIFKDFEFIFAISQLTLLCKESCSSYFQKSFQRRRLYVRFE